MAASFTCIALQVIPQLEFPAGDCLVPNKSHWEHVDHSGFLGMCQDTWKSVRPSFSKQKFPFCLLGHKSLDDARNVLLSA